MSFCLSETVLSGLKKLGVEINPEMSKKIIKNAIKLMLHSDANIPPNPEIYASQPDIVKTSEYAVVALLYLAIKYDYDGIKLKKFLDQHNVSSQTIDDFIKIYETYRQDLTVKNMQTGFSKDYINDVKWYLANDIESSSACGSTELMYKIKLGNLNRETGECKCILEFLCNIEELQFLLSKLKDLERHCETIAIDHN